MVTRRLTHLLQTGLPDAWYEAARRALGAVWGPAVVAGVLMILSFPSADVGWLAIPAWALLLVSMRLRNGEKAGRQQFVASLILYVWGLSFIQPVMTFGWLFTAVWCAALEGVFGWAMGRFLHNAPAGRARFWPVLLPAAHLLLDMLRTVLLSGFPWFLVGYAGWSNPVLIGSADLFGVHGSSLAILLLAAGLAESGARILEHGAFKLSPLLPPALLWMVFAIWTFGKADIPVSQGPLVAVLQANLPQKTKEDREAQGEEDPDSEEAIAQFVADWMGPHEDLAAQVYRESQANFGGPADLVIWPETMVIYRAVRPLDAPRNAEIWEYLAKHSRNRSTLAGVVSVEPQAGGLRWNTMVAVDGLGRVVGHQDKQHLTPGGEYIPFIGWMPFGDQLRRWVEGWAGYVPNLQPGARPEALAVPVPDGAVRFGVMICFESVFPEVARGLENAGASILVNASNYGWFEGTDAMDQALAMNAFRAAELRRSLVMASNNGISCVIDPRGRLVEGPHAYVAADTRGFLLARVPVASSRSLFSAWGEIPTWVLGVLAAGLCLYLVKKDT